MVYIIWWGAALILNTSALPSPHLAISQFVTLFPGELFIHIAVSLYRVIVSIIAALLAGVPCGMFLGRNHKANDLISPLVYILHPIPKIAFLPLLMLLLGMGDVTKVLMMAVILFFSILFISF